MENRPGVSEYALELVCTRLDRINKRLLIAMIITVILLFLSNAAWLWAWLQYDYESVETTTTEAVTVDGKDGIANYANNGGVVNNGQRESDENDDRKASQTH